MNTDIENQCISLINFCFLPRLDDKFNPNKTLYKNCLDTYLEKLFTLIKNKSFVPTPLIVSSLFILYKELTSKGPWNIEECDSWSVKLNQQFADVCNESLDNILLSQTFTNKQDVFDLCMIKLHQTLTPENFRYFPAHTEVYISVITNIKACNLEVSPQKVLPVSLILIDDFIKENKLRGLQCCAAVLDTCSEDVFQGGNYYEVIFRSLKKSYVERDIEVTKKVLECFLKMLLVLPSSVQKTNCHDLLHNTLNELHMETNLYRKALLIEAVTKVLKIIGIESVRYKKKFVIALSDNLDMCLTEGITEILLPNILECQQEWIKQCWCVSKLSTDSKMLTTLVKLFLVCQNERYLELIQKLFSTLVQLYSDEDQKKIIKDLSEAASTLKSLENLKYPQRIELLKNSLNIKI